MKNNWKTIVLMSLNGAGVDEKEADLQIRVITPMMEEYLAEQKKEWAGSIKKNFESQCSLTVDSRCKYWLRDDDDYEFVIIIISPVSLSCPIACSFVFPIVVPCWNCISTIKFDGVSSLGTSSHL